MPVGGLIAVPVFGKSKYTNRVFAVVVVIADAVCVDPVPTFHTAPATLRIVLALFPEKHVTVDVMNDAPVRENVYDVGSDPPAIFADTVARRPPDSVVTIDVHPDGSVIAPAAPLSLNVAPNKRFPLAAPVGLFGTADVVPLAPSTDPTRDHAA